ncbi:hypothetical protein CCACVL1_24786 [Corchorus capsularis]|uniref:Pentatricopeptide repeat-containing protein n=1 Tax=Corchorus capsularis TaxID=210143 RepID=A0A1R3GN06_COCAP|nr:hypothetical protein CCACVL1_24786 [Corchorus capsularis]
MARILEDMIADVKIVQLLDIIIIEGLGRMGRIDDAVEIFDHMKDKDEKIWL